MIIQAIIDWLASGLVALLSQFPTWSRPSWVTDGLSYWTSSIENASLLSHWFPLPFIALVANAVFASFILAVTIKGIRIAASFVTLGGGSAA